MKTPDSKVYLIFRIVAVVFYSLVLLTMFVPMLSLDQYVEYEFFDAEYYNEYESYYTPLATKITPLDMIKNVTLDNKTLFQYKKQYQSLQKSLTAQYEAGELTKDEFETLLAEAPETNIYYVATIYDGTADYARIQDKITLISMVAIVIYAFAAIMLLFNLFNLAFNTKFLYITNAQASWIYAAATLLYVIYIFATSLTNKTDLEKSAVREITMVCLSANGTFITLLLFEILYSIASLFISYKFNQTYTFVEEVPEFISYRIKKETQKPYVAPTPHKQKPKSYYTKKRKRKKKKKKK